MAIIASYDSKRLVDLLERAKADGEYDIQLQATYSEMREHPITKENRFFYWLAKILGQGDKVEHVPCWTESELTARYWHNDKKREIVLERFDSRDGDSRSKLQSIAGLATELIKKRGAHVFVNI